MPEVLGDRPRPQRGRDIRAKTSEGDRREIERSRRVARGIDVDRRDVDRHRRFSKVVRRSSKVVGDPRRSSKVREGFSGCPYGLGRRWRWLSRLWIKEGVPMEGLRGCRTVWG